MTKGDIADEFYWDIRKLGYLPDNDKLMALLEKVYEAGYEEGYDTGLQDYWK
jgi:hypothetical protein